jgi:hypothetical protein
MSAPTEGHVVAFARSKVADGVDGHVASTIRVSRDGDETRIIEVRPSSDPEVVTVTGERIALTEKALVATRADEAKTEATTTTNSKFHVKRPPSKTVAGNVYEIDRVPLTAASVRAYTIEGQELKPVECRVLVRSVKDQ